MKRGPYNKDKQLIAINALALGIKTNQEIADEIGINVGTLYAWKRDPKFMDAVLTQSRELLKESLPEVYVTLVREAKKGSARHIQILLDHVAKLEKYRIPDTIITFSFKEED